MQLKKLSLAASILLATSSSLIAEDYVSISYIHYNEDSGRTTILVPSIEINKDFGVDYTLNISYIYDAISGASATFYDSSSGATASSVGATSKANIVYDNIEYKEERSALSASFTTRFKNRDELIIATNISREKDYKSNEFSAEFLHWLDKSKNRALSFGLSYQMNEIDILCSLNNTTSGCDSSSSASKKSEDEDLSVINSEIGFTQIVDKTSLFKTSLFLVYEDGYLSNPYMRVVRFYDFNPTITEEQKPNSRLAYGATFEYTKAITNNISTISSYRFYSDDWDITSHTLSSQLYYEINKKLTTSFAIRYYTQTKAYFYSDKKDYFKNDKYASSDRRMSSFYSLNYALGLDYKLNNKISLNTNIALYSQPKYFDSTYFNIGAKYRF